ncbi:hypothetical protein MRB53_010361 [Persea americana]|uniref:Uncharacterized protein n=1 Tax=Persea americana TaxID=3435 RepID=A0ACC2LRR0_PERAE|nr:hypothetical protein MRB53_010361 [Persea americana]
MEVIWNEWMRNGLRKKKSQKSGILLHACTRSTGPQLGRPGTLKLVKNQVPVILSENFTDSVLSRPDLVSVDRAHSELQEITETCNFPDIQSPVYPVDIMAMMSTGYTEDLVKPPSCLTPGPSGPGQHHGHDVDRGHCRMSTEEVNIKSTRSTSQGPDHDPANDAFYEAHVVGDYKWGLAD